MNKKITIFISSILFISLLVIAIFVFKKLNSPISIGMHITLAKISSTEFVTQSDAIVIGTVKKLKTSKENSFTNSDHKDITTNATIEIEKYISNPKNLSFKEIIVQAIGGAIGNQTLTVEGSSTFNVGERVVVAIKNKHNNVFTVYGLAQGKYSIDDDNNNIGTEKELPIFENIFGKKMSLDEFEKEIEYIKNTP